MRASLMHRPRTPFDPPLDLSIRPSRRLLGGVLAAHAFFLLPAAWFALGQPWAIPLLLLPPAAATLAWRRLRLEAGCAVVRLVWEGGDGWRWHRTDGSARTGRLAAGSVCLPWLVAVSLRPHTRGRTETLLLTADSIGTVNFRRLRARLRLIPAR